MDVQSRKQLRRSLRAWYARHARDLPWRRTRDPYAIWVSEIMLQQTQVATVIPFFHRFLDHFPDIATLAAAEEAAVLRMWEGLGYYRRARSLHAAAQEIVDRHDGQFPTQFEQVLKLSGIGRYTAGAILSFAWDQRHPIVEANTERLYARLIGLRADPKSSESQRQLWDFAEEILPQKQVGQFNQALMELGATVCTPRNSSCLVCPLQSQCVAREHGWQDEIPPTKKKEYEAIDEVAVIVRRQQRVLMRQCQQQERWAGLWDFPRFQLAGTDAVDRGIENHIQQSTGLVVQAGEKITTIRHTVTRFRITLTCHQAQPQKGSRLRSEHHRWVSVSELADLPLSVTGRKIAKLLG